MWLECIVTTPNWEPQMADDTCPICHERMYRTRRGATITKLHCGHELHRRCWDVYIPYANDRALVCPLCRHDESVAGVGRWKLFVDCEEMFPGYKQTVCIGMGSNGMPPYTKEQIIESLRAQINNGDVSSSRVINCTTGEAVPLTMEDAVAVLAGMTV